MLGCTKPILNQRSKMKRIQSDSDIIFPEISCRNIFSAKAAYSIQHNANMFSHSQNVNKHHTVVHKQYIIWPFQSLTFTHYDQSFVLCLYNSCPTSILFLITRKTCLAYFIFFLLSECLSESTTARCSAFGSIASLCLKIL